MVENDFKVNFMKKDRASIFNHFEVEKTKNHTVEDDKIG